jgi:flagellar biosynthesis/type III secretory pathway protein FliH
MIEVTIPLTLRIRKVVAGKPAAGQPEWHREECARRGAGIPGTADRTPAASPPSAIDVELEQLHQQRAALANSLTELQQVVHTTDVRLDTLLGDVREATIELAHAIATKLVFEQIDGNRFPIANLVHEVLARIHSRDAAVVRLHPDDLALMQEFPVIRNAGDERALQYIADATLSRGDCKATAGEIKVVYDLRHQIEEIRRQLLSTVSGHDETGP